jgi:leucyl/phenylalanyl-tRNA--protein transferase
MLWGMRASRGLFSHPERTDSTGLVARTESLTSDMLLEAYRQGVFPWSSDPVRWYCPEPRAVFLRPYIRVPRKIGKVMRRHDLHVTFDTHFRDVIQGCADAHRAKGEWISPQFVEAYSELHTRGFAHSVEVWQGEALVGGLYGVQLGAVFCGESMFYRVSNASKVAFAYLVEQLDRIGVVLIDAQVLNEHTYRLGAVLVHRHDFLQLLHKALALPARFAGEAWPRLPEFDLATPGT